MAPLPSFCSLWGLFLLTAPPPPPATSIMWWGCICPWLGFGQPPWCKSGLTGSEGTWGGPSPTTPASCSILEGLAMGMWRGPRRDVSIPAAGGFGSRIPPVSQMWGWDYLSPPPVPRPHPCARGKPLSARTLSGGTGGGGQGMVPLRGGLAGCPPAVFSCRRVTREQCPQRTASRGARLSPGDSRGLGDMMDEPPPGAGTKPQLPCS